MEFFKKFGILFVFISLVAQITPCLSQELGKNEIVVKWSNTNSFNAGASTLKQFKGQRVKSFQTSLMRAKEKGFVEVISLPSDVSAADAITAYKSVPGVVSVEPNFVYKAVELSNDPLYTSGSLWGMYSGDTPTVGPAGTTNQFGSQAEQAWNLGHIGSSRVVVGVVDTGIDYTHPDLYLNIYLNQGEIKTLSFYGSLTDVDGDGLITFRDLNDPANSAFVTDVNANGRIDAGDLLNDVRWENGVDNDGNGFVDDLIGWDFVNNDNDPKDDQYHGTHVAGTIGAIGSNGAGVVGVNWKIQLMPLKFLNSGGSGYLSDAISAIDYYTAETLSKDVAFNANSPTMFLGTNNSWGGGGLSTLLLNSIVAGANANNHFLAAAGNSGLDNNYYSFYPANYSTLAGAGWEAVTSVASLSSNGSLSGFSNYGSTSVDLGAPGEGIMSTFPSGNYQSISGTSMATPHVTGALASFLSSFPTANRRDLRNVLLTTASPTPSLNGVVASNGRLNVLAGLVEMATRYSGGPAPTFSIIAPSTVNEGSSLTFSVSTSGVNNGTVLYWFISGVSSTDISSAPLQGSVTINSNSGSVTVTVANDNTLEGTEILIFKLFSNSGRTTQIASKEVTVADTSTGYTYFWGTTSNNALAGNDSPNFMVGVPASGITPQALGKGQVDTVTGRGGADIFLLGQLREGAPRVFYNNGVSSVVGSNDYLLITDFNRLVDKLQFVSGRYFSRNTSTNTTIYFDRNNNGVLETAGSQRDEIIAILQKVNLGNLTITESSKPAWVRYSN
jgi:subtilisin family serine protease